MRIVFVIYSLAAGGAQRVVVELASSLVARGHEVTVITYSKPDSDHFRIPNGVRRITLDLLWDSPSILASIRSTFKRLRLLRAAVADCQPNVVVSFIDLTNMLVLASTFGLRVGKVISERIDPRFHFLDWRWRIVRRLLYPLADALVVQTQAVRQWASWVVLPRKLHVIPNAARALPAAAADSSPREPFVLGVGRLHRQKGFDLLLRAFSRSKLRASGWRLVILGDGPERGNLQELAAQLRVADLVSLPGVSDTPELFMARCGVFVLSSRFEGFPNVLVEAMACGAPVVSFNCPCGPAEIIGHGRNGLLVPAGNESLLTHALDTLLADEALRQRIGAAARQVIEEFSNDRVTTMWERLMTETARPTPATEKADVATDQG